MPVLGQVNVWVWVWVRVRGYGLASNSSKYWNQGAAAVVGVRTGLGEEVLHNLARSLLTYSDTPEGRSNLSDLISLLQTNRP